MSDTIARRLLDWFDCHGRHDLPWQHPRSPYRVWLSEIMLQQTQVQTVIPYFLRFIARFPDTRTLAEAPLDDVLALWQGLGYYARARNLHRAARIVVSDYGDVWPQDAERLLALPGIGKSTAHAILAQAYDQPAAILDGNVKRVLARHEGITGWPGEPATLKKLWKAAEHHTPDTRCADYTQAIMDLGATVCGRKPDCARCPLQETCIAYRDGLTTQIPGTRKRAPLPERHVVLRVATRLGDEILVERRPEQGLWGGLWCLPLGEFSDEPPANLTTAGKPFRHVFTHFRLWLYPAQADIDTLPAHPERRWVTRQELTQLGLPKPIRTYIETTWPLWPGAQQHT